MVKGINLVKYWKHILRNRTFWLLLAASFLFYWFGYKARYGLTPDGVSYLSIAKHYANGDLVAAVNGYWPPLISWLLAPFIKLGFDGQVAFMFLNATAATAIMWISFRIIKRATKDNFVASLLFWISMTPFLCYATGAYTTPDMLTILWVLVLINMFISKRETTRYNMRPSFIVRLGLIGAVGFLTKIALLPIFVLTVLGIYLVEVVSKEQSLSKILSMSNIRDYSTRMFKIILVMVTVLTPWFAAVSAKYGQLTFSTALSPHIERRLESINTYKIATEYNAGILQPPGNDKALTRKEDLSVFILRRSETQGLDSSGIRYFVTERFKVAPRYAKGVLSMSPYILITTVGVLVAFILSKISYKKDKELSVIAVAFIAYFISYVLLSVSLSESDSGPERYNWSLLVLIILIFSIGAVRLWRSIVKGSIYKKVLFAIVICLFPIMTYVKYMPSPKLLFNESKKSSTVKLADELKLTGIAEGSRVVSNNKRPMQIVAYYLQTPTYGSIGGRSFNSPKVQAEVKKYKINYYIQFVPVVDAKDKKYKIYNAKQIDELFLERYSCRDVRYGARGAGIEPEPCIVRVYSL